MTHAIEIINATSAERLLVQIHPQDRSVSVLEAIYHVVGRFQHGTRQMIFAKKILIGGDLGLYRP